MISTTGTTVNGGGQTIDGAHTTLNVGDASKFPTSGSFTVKGIGGTCNYTGKSGNQFTGVTGCTGTPADGAAVTFVRAPGVYKWNGTNWVLNTSTIDHGTELPWTDGSHTDGTLFRLAEHEIISEGGRRRRRRPTSASPARSRSTSSRTTTPRPSSAPARASPRAARPSR